MMLKNLLRQSGHRLFQSAESHLLQHWRRYRRAEERHLERLLAALEIDCVFDVGANAGQYATMLRDYCDYKGLIISFEPTPNLVEGLKTAASRDPLWHIEPVALGKAKGELIFRTWKQSQSNSFLPLAPGAADALSNADATEIKVGVQTLNDIFPTLRSRYGFKRPFLKMDTQGYDLEVFAGGLSIMDQMLGLQSELSIQPYYDGAPDWLHALASYKAAGFILSTMIDNNDHQFPILHEMDCIMIRKPT
jgi:FkbM family methyltransferase